MSLSFAAVFVLGILAGLLFSSTQSSQSHRPETGPRPLFDEGLLREALDELRAELGSGLSSVSHRLEELKAVRPSALALSDADSKRRPVKLLDPRLDDLEASLVRLELAVEAFKLAEQRGWAKPELNDNAQVLLLALQSGEPIAQIRVLARDTRARIPEDFLDPDSALGT